jgi:phosphocarrier protein
MIKKRLKIKSVTGFAHLGCLIVSNASKFKSTILLEYKGVTIDLKNSIKSIMELITLSIKPGTYFEISANGCDEHRAIQSIESSLSQILCIEPEKQGKYWTVSNDLFFN